MRKWEACTVSPETQRRALCQPQAAHTWLPRSRSPGVCPPAKERISNCRTPQRNVPQQGKGAKRGCAWQPGRTSQTECRAKVAGQRSTGCTNPHAGSGGAGECPLADTPESWKRGLEQIPAHPRSQKHYSQPPKCERNPSVHQQVRINNTGPSAWRSVTQP